MPPPTTTKCKQQQQQHEDAGGHGPPWKHPLTVFVDYLMTFVIFAPLCVLFWRGSWQAIDGVDASFGLPPYVGPLASAVFGHSMCFLLTLCQRPIGTVLGVGRDGRRCSKPWPLLVRLVLSRLYTAVYAFALVNQWRGVWQLVILGVGKSWQAGAAVAATGAFLLASMRTLRNVMAPPLSVAPDLLDEDFVRSPTIFGLVQHQKRRKEDEEEKKQSLWLAVLDASVSVMVVSSLVVFVWCGMWTFLDAVLFVGSRKHSGLCSLVIGYSVVTVAYALQRPAAAISARLPTVGARVVFEDIFLFSASLGAINVWRGVWMMADAYIFPDNYELSNWVTSAVGLGTSMLLFAANTILARGVRLDGKLKDGSGCLFDNNYLRKILQKASKSETSSSTLDKDGIVSPAKVNGGFIWSTVEARLPAADGRLVVRDGNTDVCAVFIELETVV